MARDGSRSKSSRYELTDDGTADRADSGDDVESCLTQGGSRIEPITETAFAPVATLSDHSGSIGDA